MTSFFCIVSHRCMQQRSEQHNFRRKLIMQRIHCNIKRDCFSHPLFPYLSSSLPTIHEETPCDYPRNPEKEELRNAIVNQQSKQMKSYKSMMSSLYFLFRQKYPFPHHFPLRS